MVNLVQDSRVKSATLTAGHAPHTQAVPPAKTPTQYLHLKAVEAVKKAVFLKTLSVKSVLGCAPPAQRKLALPASITPSWIKGSAAVKRGI
jgi:hypothetical protein